MALPPITPLEFVVNKIVQVSTMYTTLLMSRLQSRLCYGLSSNAFCLQFHQLKDSFDQKKKKEGKERKLKRPL